MTSKSVRVIGKSNDVWVEISKLRGGARIAAIAYLGDNAPTLLGQFRHGDTIVCDASDERIRSGSTSKAALSEFLKRGVRLYSLKNLHAKVICIGPTAVIGSMNASTSSTQMREAAVFLTGSQGVGASREFVRGLLKDSVAIDEQFLKRIDKIPPRRRGKNLRTSSNPADLETIVLDPVVRAEPPRYVATATTNRVQDLPSRAGFKIRSSWDAPQGRRFLRVNDLVLWVYQDDGIQPTIEIGRIIDFEKIRNRWIYYELTPTRSPRLQLVDLKHLIVASGYSGREELLGAEFKRISLPNIDKNIRQLFGNSYPEIM
jgi:hypothetical protein